MTRNSKCKWYCSSISFTFAIQIFVCPTLYYNYEIVLKTDLINVINTTNVICGPRIDAKQCFLDLTISPPVYDNYNLEITPVNVHQGDIRGPTYFSPRISENL